VIAGVIIIGLVAALICDHNEQIKDLFKACIPNGDKLREELYGKQLDEELEKVPTIGECVKILEKDPIACEVLERIGRDIVKEKEKEKMNTEMPGLMFGDVVKWDDDHYGMVGNDRVYYLINVNGLMGPSGVSKDTVANIQNDKHVVKVYRKSLANGFDQTDLYSIQQGCAQRYVIWEKQQVREMTVDEISKELGYTVKVVGEK
jgi:hypothetical protein